VIAAAPLVLIGSAQSQSKVSSDTFRNGQQSAFAVDVIELTDALGIEKAVVAGFDWGAHGMHRCGALARAL
jgi:pimeloyl-ACP methyl ester carboxylesterase